MHEYKTVSPTITKEEVDKFTIQIQNSTIVTKKIMGLSIN